MDRSPAFIRIGAVRETDVEGATTARQRELPWPHLALFGLTAGSTFLAGINLADTSPGSPPGWQSGLLFCIPLLLILGVHELGHYLACRWHGVRATLPYFVPFPLGIGTLGAFIKIRSPIPDRKVLMDVGASGPWAGMLLALPVTLIGLALSEVRFLAHLEHALDETLYWELGEPILFGFLAELVCGPVPPGWGLMLHPIAYAGWIGFLLTAINLLPLGQLDGGHVLYALFPRRQRTLGIALFAFVLMAAVPLYLGWLVLGAILLVVGLGHPPTLQDRRPLGRRRRLVGAASILLFLLTFTPVPIRLSAPTPVEILQAQAHPQSAIARTATGRAR